MPTPELPLPSHFDPQSVAKVWKVNYQDLAPAAESWRSRHRISPAAADQFRIALVLVDVQNTFCLPEFELFVAGRSGTGAIDDNRRLCKFLYHNLHAITQIFPTLDTHQPIQIFHPIFLVNPQGEHPPPFTEVSVHDVEEGNWKVNPAVSASLGLEADYLQRHLLHYTRVLEEGGKYRLTVWPYHALLGGTGHALVSAVQEAIFFHSLVRESTPEFQIKGQNPLTEHYSALGPEVLTGPEGEQIAEKNTAFLRKLADFDMIILTGQAKSHCLAWTIDDLLEDPLFRPLARKVYLLEDCTSPVVVPGLIDFTDQADAAFRRFADAGMHVVRSTDPISRWPEVGAS